MDVMARIRGIVGRSTGPSQVFETDEGEVTLVAYDDLPEEIARSIETLRALYARRNIPAVKLSEVLDVTKHGKHEEKRHLAALCDRGLCVRLAAEAYRITQEGIEVIEADMDNVSTSG